MGRPTSSIAIEFSSESGSDCSDASDDADHDRRVDRDEFRAAVTSLGFEWVGAPVSRESFRLPATATTKRFFLTYRQTVYSGLAPAPPTTFSRAAPPGLTRLTVRVVTQLRARPASYACPSASSKSEAYTAQDDG